MDVLYESKIYIQADLSRPALSGSQILSDPESS